MGEREFLGKFLKENIDKITGIIHIGASFCEENDIYIGAGVKESDIYWFEGQPAVVNRMKGRVSHIYQAVLSSPEDEGKMLQLKVASNSYSSSLLDFKEHKDFHPEISEVYRIDVICTTMDTLIKNNYWEVQPNFALLDIQGSELKCLQGMTETLKKIDYVFTEVNISELYEGCCLMSDLDEFFDKINFKREWTLINKMNYGDALYVRQKDNC